MTVIPALSSVNDILDSDLVVITHSTGDSYKMTGADLKAKIQAVTAPVDEVTSGNMHSVTSNAVANHIINLSGSFNVNISGNSYENATINLPQTLPNSNYVVTFEARSTGSILFTLMDKTTTQLNVNIRNFNNADLPITCYWSLICKR